MPESKPDVIRIAAEASGKLLVHATGNPAKIVAVGVAAATVFVGVAVGYGGYRGVQYLIERRRRALPPVRRSPSEP